MEANYFTVLWWVLPYIDMNQPRVYMCSIFLVFWGTSMLFSIVAAPIYIPINGAGGFPFSTASPAFIICRLIQFSSVKSLSRVWRFATPWTAESQASLSITNSQSLLKLMSTESVMPSNYLILYHPLLLMPSIFPSIRVFSSESVLRIRWPKYQSFSFSISLSNEHSGLISFRTFFSRLLFKFYLFILIGG